MGAQLQSCERTCCSNGIHNGQLLFSATKDEHFVPAYKATVPGCCPDVCLSELDNINAVFPPARAPPQKLDVGWAEANAYANDSCTLPIPTKATDYSAQAAMKKARKEEPREANEAKEAKALRVAGKGATGDTQRSKGGDRAMGERRRSKGGEGATVERRMSKGGGRATGEERDAREKAEKEEREHVAKAKAKKEAEEKAEEQKFLENAGPLGKPGASLEICLDNGWKPLDDDEIKQIRNQLAGGNKKFAIPARGSMYIVDFTDANNPTHSNAMTQIAHKLRVVLP